MADWIKTRGPRERWNRIYGCCTPDSLHHTMELCLGFPKFLLGASLDSPDCCYVISCLISCMCSLKGKGKVLMQERECVSKSEV